MGIDITSLHSILISQKYIFKKTNMLTLGRQCIHINSQSYNDILNFHNIPINNSYSSHCETLFNNLGFSSIDSIDNSSYENANIIHDLNKKINVIKKYDYIYDGGTIEHVFNIPQLFDNVVNLLEIDGIFCSVTCNNNLSGHGFYQFSPEIFLSSFTPQYGMQLLELHIAKVNTEMTEWIDVKSYGSDSTGRNTSRFLSNDLIYIITIAKKISELKNSFVEFAPQQYSYEKIDWKK